MFDVTLYTFAKKQRSTAIPSGTGTTVSCMAKEPLDILNPTIRLQLSGGAAANPQAYNYARINALERWYHIRSWRNVGPIWEADLQVDALASWRLTLGAQSIYVYRSATSYDNHVADSLYPETSKRHRLNINLPKPWTIGGASASGAAADSGIYVLGIIGTGQTNYYGFTKTQLDDFMAYLFSDAYYEAVLTDFGAAEYPEAKVAINPLQYITSCRFVPMGVSTPALGGLAAWTLHASSITGVQVGNILLTSQQAYAFMTIAGTAINYHTVISYYDLALGSDFWHPQADDRGDWLNLAPHTTYELYYPPFGLLKLDPAEISSASTIRFRLTIDVWTCDAVLDVIVDPGTTSERTMLRVTGTIGADVPLSNIMKPGSSTMALAQAGAAMLEATAAVSPSGLITAERAAVRTLVDGRIPHLSTMGSQGSTAQLAGQPRLMVTHWQMANDDLRDRGRPLCAVRQISAIPGYIMGDPDSLSIACTLQEMEEIRQAVAGGFYYE